MSKTKIKFLTLSDRGQSNDIVFIHGFGGSIKAGLNFAEIVAMDEKLKGWSVRSFGYTTGLAPNMYGIWTGRPSLPKLSQLLRSTIENRIPKQNRIALVAHSMGGLVVQRAILDDKELRDRLSFVFLFGTPSDGLQKASFGRRFLKLFRQQNRQVRDMAHDSEFIADLRKRRPKVFNNPPFVFRVSAGDKDEFVPASSSLKPFDKSFQRVVPGNHLQIIRPKNKDNESVKLVVNTILGDAAYAGPWNSARAAVERGDFQAAIAAYEPYVDELDEERMVELALAYEYTDQADKSLDVLSKHAQKYGKKHLDVIGVMAGRYKRRWLLQGTLPDATQAFNLYKEGYASAVKEEDHEMAHYLGINVAFMLVAMNRGTKKKRQEAQQIAREVLIHCNEDDSHWKIASEAEALLHLEQIDNAILRYKDFVSTNPKPRELASAYQQAEYLIKYIFKNAVRREKVAQQLEEIFRPIVQATN